MCDNPSTLLDACLDYICDHMSEVFEPYCVPQLDGWNPDSYNYEEWFRFRDKEMYLFNELSEMLLEKLVEKSLASDTTLSIFDEANTCLKRVKLKNSKNISLDGLKVLLRHKIQELECVSIRNISINRIIESLNPWSAKNLRVFGVARCTFIDLSRFSYMVQLTELKNLRSLNVAYTELNQPSFQMLCEDLIFLEKLNISGTCVKDLGPLMSLANQLLILGISDLRLCPSNASHILRLRRLKQLDISIINEKLELTDNNIIKLLLSNNDALQELCILDISGWRNPCEKEVLFNFIDCHEKLEYLGLVTNPIANDPIFFEKKKGRKVRVAGLAAERQIRRTLTWYEDKPFFVQKALYHLFQLTTGFQGPRPDIVEKVLIAMDEHAKKFGVQVAGTACLYNLTRADLAKHICPRLLSKGVNLILNAMSRFHEEYQLQKNSLLNLCSDRILQEVNFDKFRCAKLVLDALCAFDEPNMNRMAVAICSILAAKVSTAETSELGARPVYMRKLLAMVQGRVEMKQADITMKFTLSALWNLTDESAATCYVFLEQGGASLFLNVLQTFKGDNAIETKVLGLLNNIAEVELLRHSLLIEALINELFCLLKSEHIDVSYFAAGIVAHLASDGEEKWTIKCYTRREMLGELECTITQWKLPECEMVAYRSFKPFFPLLCSEMDYQVQLWAVWAIYHVCNKNPKRYCIMLSEERGITLLKNLANFEESHPTIKKITKQILGILELNMY